MNTSMFNFHDLVLIITSAGALLLSFGLFFLPRKNRMSRKLLGGFFFCESITNLLYLFFWHSLLRPFSLDHSSLMTLIFIVVTLSKGPMLYFYVLSILDHQFVLIKRQVTHLFISPIAAVLLVFVCDLGLSHAVPATPFLELDQLSYLFSAILLYVPWCYALLCLREISRMSAVLKGFYASASESGTGWFQLMIIGYIIVWSWRLFTELFSGYLSTIFISEIPNIFGLTSNYLGFFLFFALYFYSVSNVYQRLTIALENIDTTLNQTDTIRPHRSSATIDTGSALDTDVDAPSANDEIRARDDSPPLASLRCDSVSESTAAAEQFFLDTGQELALCAQRIADSMENQRIYLDHAINLERFSERINERPRTVSCALNTIFKISFFEFINGYRVAEAKRLLLLEEGLSIAEVIERSGFSSKSAFHRAFKAATQMTASQFRNN